MSDLIALALACDQTRVFSIMFSGSTATTVFWQVNVIRGHHQLSHDEAGDQPQIQATTVFTMKMFSMLLQKLKASPEGPGNLLDSCAILASSDCAEGKSHSNRDYPILVAGSARRQAEVPRHPLPRPPAEPQPGAAEHAARHGHRAPLLRPQQLADRHRLRPHRSLRALRADSGWQESPGGAASMPRGCGARRGKAPTWPSWPPRGRVREREQWGDGEGRPAFPVSRGAAPGVSLGR